VIIDNFHIGGHAGTPVKADTVLVIHPYGVLTSTVPLERFQAIARWNTQIIQAGSNLQLTQFPSGYKLYADKP